MGVVTHKKVSGIADGGDASLVRPSDWNDEHSVGAVTGTVEITDAEWICLNDLAITGTDDVSLIGTAELFIFGWTDSQTYNIVGRPRRFVDVPFRVPNDYEFIVSTGSLVLEGIADGIVEGSGELILSDDFGTRSDIVMTGVG